MLGGPKTKTGVKKARKKNNLTREQVAEVANISVSSLKKVETGGLVSEKTLRKIGTALAMDLDVLIQDAIKESRAGLSPDLKKERFLIDTMTKESPETIRYQNRIVQVAAHFPDILDRWSFHFRFKSEFCFDLEIVLSAKEVFDLALKLDYTISYCDNYDIIHGYPGRWVDIHHSSFFLTEKEFNAYVKAVRHIHLELIRRLKVYEKANRLKYFVRSNIGCGFRIAEIRQELWLWILEAVNESNTLITSSKKYDLEPMENGFLLSRCEGGIRKLVCKLFVEFDSVRPFNRTKGIGHVVAELEPQHFDGGVTGFAKWFHEYLLPLLLQRVQLNDRLSRADGPFNKILRAHYSCDDFDGLEFRNAMMHECFYRPSRGILKAKWSVVDQIFALEHFFKSRHFLVFPLDDEDVGQLEEAIRYVRGNLIEEDHLRDLDNHFIHADRLIADKLPPHDLLFHSKGFTGWGLAKCFRCLVVPLRYRPLDPKSRDTLRWLLEPFTQLLRLYEEEERLRNLLVRPLEVEFENLTYKGGGFPQLNIAFEICGIGSKRPFSHLE